MRAHREAVKHGKLMVHATTRKANPNNDWRLNQAQRFLKVGKILVRCWVKAVGRQGGKDRRVRQAVKVPHHRLGRVTCREHGRNTTIHGHDPWGEWKSKGQIALPNWTRPHQSDGGP